MSTDAGYSSRIEQRKVLAKVLRVIIRRRLGAVALFTLESTKPLSFLASQSLIVFEPIIRTFLPVRDYDVFVQAIEDRDNIEWMIEQLERAEEKQIHRRRTAAKQSDES